MKLFDRFAQPKRPRYDTKVIAPEQTKDDPVTPIPETPELVQICAACGKLGAINQLGSISCFGYITLRYVYLCDDCESTRIENKQKHYDDLHRRPIAARETVEVSALEAKAKRTKPRVGKVTLMEQTSLLEERAHDLGA